MSDIFCVCFSAPGVVIIKKPGGSETVFDIGGDFEAVSGVDDEKYAWHVFIVTDYKYVEVNHASSCCQCLHVLSLIFLIIQNHLDSVPPVPCRASGDKLSLSGMISGSLSRATPVHTHSLVFQLSCRILGFIVKPYWQFWLRGVAECDQQWYNSMICCIILCSIYGNFHIADNPHVNELIRQDV